MRRLHLCFLMLCCLFRAVIRFSLYFYVPCVVLNSFILPRAHHGPMRSGTGRFVAISGPTFHIFSRQLLHVVTWPVQGNWVPAWSGHSFACDGPVGQVLLPGFLEISSA
jgi:hypothetical protein